MRIKLVQLAALNLRFQRVAKMLDTRFSGIVGIFATALGARCIHAKLCSRHPGCLQVSPFEHAGPAGFGNGADRSLGVQSRGRVLTHQQAELLFRSLPHPSFFSAKKSLNRSDSIANRASDMTRW